MQVNHADRYRLTHSLVLSSAMRACMGKLFDLNIGIEAGADFMF